MKSIISLTTLLFLFCSLFNSPLTAAGTKEILLSPKYMGPYDLTICVSAIKVKFSGFTSTDAPKYVLQDSKNSMYARLWNGTQFTEYTKTGTSLTAKEYVEGKPFWIVYQLNGMNPQNTRWFSHRVAPYTGTSVPVISLDFTPPTFPSNTFFIEGHSKAKGTYTPTPNNSLALAYNSANELLCVAPITDTEGLFHLVCPSSETVTKVTVENLDGSEIHSVTGSWNTVPGQGTTVECPVSLSSFELQ